MDQNIPSKSAKRTILSLKKTVSSDVTTPAKAMQEPVVAESGASVSLQTRASDQAAQQLAEWLGQHSRIWRDFLPLNIGVISEVYTLLQNHGIQDAWSKRVIHKTLYWHTTRIVYWEQLLTHPHRYGLDGQIGGEVTEAQREHARQELAARIGYKMIMA